MAVFAPIPSAIESIALTVKPGDVPSVRIAKRTSLPIGCIGTRHRRAVRGRASIYIFSVVWRSCSLLRPPLFTVPFLRAACFPPPRMQLCLGPLRCWRQSHERCFAACIIHAREVSG